MSAQSWSLRRAATVSRRRIKTLKAAVDKHLSDIALMWADEDSFIERAADDLIHDFQERLDELQREFESSVVSMEQRDAQEAS